jgi:hypothetical protein
MRYSRGDLSRLVVAVARVLGLVWVPAPIIAAVGIVLFVRYVQALGACRTAECAAALADAWIPGFVLMFGGFALFIGGLTAGRYAANRLDAWDVRRIGRDATATVLAASDARLVVNHTPLRRLRLRVEPTDGAEPFEARMEELGYGLRAGLVLAVLYDPDRPSRVALAERAS